MEKKAKFLAGLATIVAGVIFILVIGLRFFGDIVVTDFRTSTMFEQDLKKYAAQPYLTDGFDTYENTQQVNFQATNDFSSFGSKGIIVGWADVEDYSQIDSIDLELRDSSSSYTIKGIDNKPQLPRTANDIWTDDEFVDYAFTANQTNNVWRDWMLANGENMVFWEWNEPLPLNMKEITVKTSYPVRDAFILKDFSREETPTGGNWIAPHGLLQYGFHYVQDGFLYMKNVRQTQMVTNGDHVRIISNTLNTPRDFIMRVRFTATRVPKEPASNDYVRIAWDFEDKWDPGHDQTLVYISGQYKYFGMQRVYPIIRQKEQGYENSPKTGFKMKNNRVYEIDVRVQGQNARATIYEHRWGILWQKASVEYTFETPRPAESYPFSIEATGNPNLKVDYIEVYRIADN
jgi:hypothetical protein